MFLIICWISSSPDPDNAMAKKWKQEKGMMGDAFKRNTSVLQSVGASGKYRNVWLLQDQSEFFSAMLSDLIRTRRHGAACPVWETETEITATVKKGFFLYIYISIDFSPSFFSLSVLSLSPLNVSIIKVLWASAMWRMRGKKGACRGWVSS